MTPSYHSTRLYNCTSSPAYRLPSKHICLLDGESLADFVNYQLPFPQSIENRNPKRMCQRFEEFCFEVA